MYSYLSGPLRFTDNTKSVGYIFEVRPQYKMCMNTYLRQNLCML